MDNYYIYSKHIIIFENEKYSKQMCIEMNMCHIHIMLNSRKQIIYVLCYSTIFNILISPQIQELLWHIRWVAKKKKNNLKA